VRMAALSLPEIKSRVSEMKVKVGKAFVAEPPAFLRRDRFEDSFRVLGLHMDASIDLIQTTMKGLRKKYAHDVKRSMILEKAFDEVLTLRFSERARDGESETKKVQDRKELKEKVMKITNQYARLPRWMRRIPLMWLPIWDISKLPEDKQPLQYEYARWITYLALIAEVFVILAPPTTAFVSWFLPIIYVLKMATRGGKPPKMNSEGMVIKRDPMKWTETAWAAAIQFFCAFMATALFPIALEILYFIPLLIINLSLKIWCAWFGAVMFQPTIQSRN